MIKLTRVDGDHIFVNEHFIETFEATSESDTAIRIHNGTTFVVQETPEAIRALIVEWQHPRRADTAAGPAPAQSADEAQASRSAV